MLEPLKSLELDVIDEIFLIFRLFFILRKSIFSRRMFRAVIRPLLCVAESPLVKTTGFIQHTFRWGIGNKFRAISANRYSPVHHARPKEVTIPENYFESPQPEEIKFDHLNEQWEVYWFEHHKLHAKPFPVKKFGVDQSKNEAMKFLTELKNSGRFSDSVGELKSNVDSVMWDERLQMWMSLESGKGFSASKHGVEGARTLAEDDAKKAMKKINLYRSEIDKQLARK